MASKTNHSVAAYDLFVFAGEASGDLHGSALIKNLRLLRPDIKLFGVAGPKMRAEGIDCILNSEQFQVMGFIPVFLSLPKLIRYFYRLADEILQKKPKAVLFIDYPGFGLRLEKHLKKKGFTGKIIHYICPSVWAWGKKRIPLMEQTLSLLISIFPFEKKYFSGSFPIKYVGNPLVSRIKNHFYEPLNFPEGTKVIGLFPGSRKKEIESNFVLQLKALEHLMKKDPSVIGAVSVSREKFLPLLKQKTDVILNDELRKKIHFIPIERSYDLMKTCFAAIAKSGTVTLELALHKVPSVVVYAIPPLDLFIAKNILRIILPFYCIVNIIAEKRVFTELIGPNAQEKTLCEEAEKLLFDLSYRKEKNDLCEEVAAILGPTDASQLAAELVLSYLP